MAAKQKESTSSIRLAAVLIRGGVGLTQDKLRTLELLKLQKKNVCGVFNDSPVIRGMLTKVSDLVTWGEVDATTLDLLKQKRGLGEAPKQENPHFFMSPPRGGFERKGIKEQFAKGGALGYRGEKINALIQRMV